MNKEIEDGGTLHYAKYGLNPYFWNYQDILVSSQQWMSHKIKYSYSEAFDSWGLTRY